MMMIMMQKSG